MVDKRRGSGLRSLKGADGVDGQPGPQGSSGAQGVPGPQGAPGVGITTSKATGADAANYQDFTTLVSLTLTTPGDYVIFATFTADNTGAQDEYLNCGYRFDGTINGSGGADTTAGNSTTTTAAGVLNVSSAGTAEFICTENGNTTYDIHDIEMRAHYLG